MKAIVETRELNAALKTTSAAVAARPTMPVLAGAVLTPSDRGLTVTTFDLETSVVVDVAAIVDGESGPVAVSHRLLSQIVAVAGTQQLSLRFDAKDSTVLASAGQSEWKLPVLPVDKFPRLPVMPPAAGVVAADLLSDAIRDVTLAAGGDQTLPMLTGMRVAFGPDDLTLASTDRYRIHERLVPWKAEDVDLPDPVIVPARALRPLITHDVGDVDIAATTTLFTAAVSHTQFTTRLLDAQFPAYRPLFVPRDRVKTVVTVSPANLALAVRQVEAANADRVVLKLQPDRILVTGRDLERNSDVGLCEIDAVTEGDPMNICVNAGFLADALSGVDDVAELWLTQSTKPIMVMRPGHDDRIAMVMPLRLPE